MKWIKEILTSYVDEEYKEEFAFMRLDRNMRHSQVMALLILVLELLILGVSFIPSIVTNYEGYEGLYRLSYTFIIIVAIQFYGVIAHFRKNYKNHKVFLNIYLLTMGFLIVMGFIAITLLDQYRGVNSFVYLFILMGCSIIVNMRPSKSFSLFFIVHIIFLVSGHVIGLDKMTLFSNYINMTSVVVTISVISYMLHKYQMSDYMKTVMIRKQNDALDLLSKTDSLTGIYNRRSLDEMLRTTYESAKKKGTTIAVVMIDIDYFKEYNDTYGHIKGDEALVRIAHILRDILHSQDGYAFRYGGDELVALIPSTTREVVDQLMSALVEGVKRADIKHEKSLSSDQITLSLGVHCERASSSISLWSMIDKADVALYEAKKARKPKSR